MKILIIARTCPFPANDGEKIRVFNLLKNLSHHEITFVCRSMSTSDQSGVAELEKYCKHVHLIYIPSPKSLFKKVQWVLPFVFSRYPLVMSTVFFNPILQSIRDVCEKNNFDIIQVEHSSLTIYLDYLSIPKSSRLILTMHNIDFIRNERVIEHLPFGIEKIYQQLNQMRFKKWELASLRRYDSVIAMSSIDKSIMLDNIPDINVSIVPNGVDTKEVSFVNDKRHFKNSHNIIFVASMDSDANHDGAMYFINEIFPLVKSCCSDAVIYLVGRSPRKELAEKHNGSDIIVTGMVESVYAYYTDAAVAVVPLRSGGGTRLKILEAMAAGVPVVSTTVGAEGINVIADHDILFADNPEEFARSIVELLTDLVRRNRVIDNARKKVEQEYDWKVIAKQHDLVYSSTLKL